MAALFVLWLAVLNFRPVTSNDFWIHLRIGEDILRTGRVPRIDDYSGVAAGAPFMAYEWLGGVVVAAVVGMLGPAGATLLREAAALGVGVLLFLSLPRELRASPLVVPLLVLAAYLTCWRVEVRPDLFTMVVVAAFVFAVERWRRTRRALDLAWLVPLEALWTNLHGAFPFGVVLTWGIAACAAAAAAWPPIQGTDRPYTWRDVATAALVAAGCSIAPLANPYGTALVVHTVSMSQGHEFEVMRTAMSEWQPPFAATSYFRGNFPYLVVGFALQLVLLWTAVLVRLRERPLLDLFAAAIVTWLGVGANRFIPYAAIVGFPIVVRSGETLLSKTATWWVAWRERPARRLVESGLVVALVVVTLRSGYPYGPQRHGDLGWGYGGRRPVAEADYIRAHHLEGPLYNEVMTEGSFLVHELSPAVRPVMDARVDFVGEARYLEYQRTHESAQALLAFLQHYDVRLALVTRDGWMGPYLERTGQWDVVLRTGDHLVLTRR